MQRNHTVITGPNTLPRPPVPRRWMAKRPSRTKHVTGTTAVLNPGAASSTPSIALSTLMAGVMIPSP